MSTSESTPERFAIVTGGSAGIGAAITRQMVEAGYTVLSLARRPPAITDQRVIGVPVDLADRAATEQVAAELAAQYPITTIIHNAGVIREKLLDDATQEDLAVLSQLHLGAPMALVKANLATMRSQHYGRILLMSTRAILGLARRTVYSTTKAGMLGMARTWALELAGDGITCNVVCPGPIQDTEMFHDVIPKDSPKLDQIAGNVPVGRLGEPNDVARAVLFFTAPESGFITGQTLFVCGGTSVGSITY